MSTPVKKSTPGKSPAASSSAGTKGKATPDARSLPLGQYEVAQTPVKAVVGGDVAVLDFVATVVQMCPSDMEHGHIRPDSCVVLRMMGDRDRVSDILGIGRAWPQRSMKPGRVRLGWQLFGLNQAEFEENTCIIRVVSLEACESVVPRSIPVAKQVWLTASIASEFARLSVVDAPSPPPSDLSLAFVMNAAAKRVLRGSALVDGSSVTVRVRGSPTVLSVARHSLQSPAASGITSNLFTVGPDTVVTVVSGSGTPSEVTAVAVSPEDAAPGAVVRHSISSVSASDIGGMRAQVETIQRMLHLPLRSPEVFTTLGLQPYRGILLHGPPGSGKTYLGKSVVSRCNVPTFFIHGPELFSQFVGSSESFLRDVFSQASAAAPSVIFIDDIDSMCPPRSEASEVEARMVGTLLTLMDGIRTSEAVVVVATTSKLGSIDPALCRAGRFDREVEIGVPSTADRTEIMKLAFTKLPHGLCEDEFARLAGSTHGYVAGDLIGLCKEAAMAALRRRLTHDGTLGTGLAVTAADVWGALAKTGPSALREVAVDVPKVLWSDIGGQEAAKQAMKEAVEWPLRHPEAFHRMGIRPPKGVLLYGPPGCSKTMMAKALATEGGMNFIAVKGPEFLSKWVGESEKAVQDVFRKARAASPCVVFFDEIDAIAVTRSGGGGSDVMSRVVSQLLHELDGVSDLKRVVVVAATNRPDLLDAAFLRPGRIDRMLYIGPPDGEARRQIIVNQLSRIPHDADCGRESGISSLVEATDGFSGAECAAFLREAALTALTQDLSAEMITLSQALSAARHVKPQITSDMLAFYAKFRTGQA